MSCVSQWVSEMWVSHAPNGRPAPNIHTWDSHMPYGYFPEMFEIFTKLPKMDTLFGTKRFGKPSHTLKKWSKIVPIEIAHNQRHMTCPIWTGLLVLTSPKGATPPPGVLSSLLIYKINMIFKIRHHLQTGVIIHEIHPKFCLWYDKLKFTNKPRHIFSIILESARGLPL